MASTYSQGESVVCMTEWKALDLSKIPVPTRALTDPSSISCSVTAPDASVSTPTPTKVSTGVYYVSVLASQIGTYTVTWTGTGAAAGVKRRSFSVVAL